MDANSAKLAYGVAPPDLSVIARSRSADWLYTYLRSFYVDDQSPKRMEQHDIPQCGHAVRVG